MLHGHSPQHGASDPTSFCDTAQQRGSYQGLGNKAQQKRASLQAIGAPASLIVIIGLLSGGVAASMSRNRQQAAAGGGASRSGGRETPSTV